MSDGKNAKLLIIMEPSLPRTVAYKEMTVEKIKKDKLLATEKENKNHTESEQNMQDKHGFKKTFTKTIYEERRIIQLKVYERIVL